MAILVAMFFLINFSLYNDEAKVKPYFQEKIVATTENVHLVVCVHGLDGKAVIALFGFLFDLSSPFCHKTFIQ